MSPTPLEVAQEAERALNSTHAKQGSMAGRSDSGISSLTFFYPTIPFPSSQIPRTGINSIAEITFLSLLLYLGLQPPSEIFEYQRRECLVADWWAANESGVDTSVENKFPGAKVTYGSAASGAGDNREIPVEEGGDVLKNGRPTKARDFEGEGGPEDKMARAVEDRGGDDDVEAPVRQKLVNNAATL